MTRVKVRHYVRKRKRGFWQPTQEMRRHGFKSMPLGEDGPGAWSKAEEWNARWDRVKRGDAPSPALADASNLSPDQLESLTVYPAGSIGEAFKRYRQTEEFARKALRTREDWWRAWRQIKPIFGDVDPRTVSLEDVSAWRKLIEGDISLREAHRCVKIWRALWKAMAAMQYCDRDADPSLGVRNSAPKGRAVWWREGEAVRLCKQAWRSGYRGLAAVIAVAWDTQLSPGDVRALTTGQLTINRAGAVFFTERAKTGKPVGGQIGKRALAVYGAYLEGLGVKLLGDAPIFRNRSGQPYSKDTLGDDFREVRAQAFGDGEKRTLADFRRSGAVEAIAGGATPAELSHAMGNTLSASNTLFETYSPGTQASIRSVTDARRRSRSKIRENDK